MYKCPHCPKTFEKGQSLGGHKSKVHPETPNTRAKLIK